MGLFSPAPGPIQTHPPPPKPSPDGAFEAPNRDSRALCWQARDQFFACLERHEITDPIKNAEEARRCCGPEEGALERECVPSWVTYFKQRRVMELKKKQTLERLASEGAKPMVEGISAPGAKGN